MDQYTKVYPTDQARYIVTTNNADVLVQFDKVIKIGCTVAEPSISFDDGVRVKVDDLRAAHEAFLPALMG